MLEFLLILSATAVAYLGLRRYYNKAVPEPAEPNHDRAARKPRRTKAEIEAAREEQTRGLKDEFRANSINATERMAQAGITHYRWLSSGDERVCEYCQANHGKVFRLMDPPATGHPGQVNCCNGQACRCTMTPLINGMDA